MSPPQANPTQPPGPPYYEDTTPRQIAQVAGCSIVDGAGMLTVALSKKYPQHALTISKNARFSGKWLWIAFTAGWVLEMLYHYLTSG